VDVLIDLNGHTLRTGLPLFTYKPALVQLTFLGYPLTTALPYIDHVIVDHIAYPPHVAKAHTEKFVRGFSGWFLVPMFTVGCHRCTCQIVSL
jgi:protein O-GlcNAc transferase